MNLVVIAGTVLGIGALILFGAPELLAIAGPLKFSEMPIRGMTSVLITQRFNGHKGIDIGVPIGTPCINVAPGVVTGVIDSPTANGGKQVIVKGRLPYAPTIGWGYAHLSQISVAVGQELNAGDVVGLSGNTGSTLAKGDASPVLNRTDGRGAHLHFTVIDTIRGDVRINPAPFLPISI